MEWLFLSLLVALVAYGLGVQIEKERQKSRNYAAAEERENQVVEEMLRKRRSVAIRANGS